MPTTVTKSIGSAGGRDYSSIAAWFAGSPASLTVADEIWRGEGYNDSEFAEALLFSGITTDATRYVELTAAAGQSFQDNANVRTNALTYNQANGIGNRVTTGYATVFRVQIGMRISKWQVKTTALTSSQSVRIQGIGTLTKDCILESNGNNPFSCDGAISGTVVNVLAVNNNSGGNGFQLIHYSGTFTFVGCAAVRPSNRTAGGTGFNNAGGATAVIKSCASFGFTTPSASCDAASQNNGTEQSSGFQGSSNQYSITYSAVTPFTQADSTGSLDFQPIASTALAANGFLDSTNAPNDITGMARTGTPTIGVWELASSGPAFMPRFNLRLYQAINRASTY